MTEVDGELRVVATAGHVDHGKSSLIVRLTGMDPDRWAEEKRRGLTIDLGYAWCALPSGREIGFVDVPGHERFVRNMLAGVGPVRLVLFVVAADEGWKPQSEEHLQILDVLGVTAGVIALTKRDLVDDEALLLVGQDIRERLAGTALAGAPIVPVSSSTGEGVAELLAALDAMFASAPRPADERMRLFVDRVFTIKGAGTVVTGTLTGRCLTIGDEVELFPTGKRARVRSLQSHKRTQRQACPVARVAANLVGAERQELERGDVLGTLGAWRATTMFDALLRPVRGLKEAMTSRGAYKVYAGAAEADAQLRFLGAGRLDPGGEAFARIRLSRPLVLDVHDRFVLREAGRRATVGGGVVLDVAPPVRPGPDAPNRLRARLTAARDDLPGLLVAERGAAPAPEVARLTGSATRAGDRAGAWLVHPPVREAVETAVVEVLTTFHRDHELEEGASLALARAVVQEALHDAGAPTAPDLVEALLVDLTERGLIARAATTVRLSGHRIRLEERAEDLDRLVAAIGGEREATPPTIPELVVAGFAPEMISAAARAGAIVKITPELVLHPEFVARAEAAVREAGAVGITVSSLRERLGTSRKYAVPLVEYLDRTGVTRREGDLRFSRETG